MTPTKNTGKILSIVSKIFLIGLLLQFFLQTFFTYKLGLTWPVWNIIWMRKEIMLIWIFWTLIYTIQQHRLRKWLRKNLPIKQFTILFLVVIAITAIISLLINHTGLNAYILSIKYSLIGFFIFIVFFTIKFIEEGNQDMEMAKRYSNIIKKILIFALMWRWVIRLMPNIMRYVGYDQYNVEWKMWIAPPAAYYTQYNEGYVRNQFLFERPISLGFFLVVFWPLFFMCVIKKRGWKNALWRGWMFGIIMLSTFSRAARIAWFAQTALLIFIEYRKRIVKIALYGGLPMLILFGWITYVGRDQIIGRDFSNIGHFNRIAQALEKIKEKPLRGQWAATAWPASYQIMEEWYNPENQFLQIWIEYGALGFIGWMLLYLYLHKIWYLWYQIAINEKNSKQERFNAYIILAFSLWLLGLSIEWLVLHSFVDRMVVYPFMALFGIAYAVYWKNRTFTK